MSPLTRNAGTPNFRMFHCCARFGEIRGGFFIGLAMKSHKMRKLQQDRMKYVRSHYLPTAWKTNRKAIEPGKLRSEPSVLTKEAKASLGRRRNLVKPSLPAMPWD